MKHFLLSLLFIVLFGGHSSAQQAYLNACDFLYKGEEQIRHLAKNLTVSNDVSSSHVQGIAVDLERGYIYFSFTTKLLKTDFSGNVVGSVQGFSCHLGCLELDRETGKLYASVEYKDDAIGEGISGSGAKNRENTFYIGIFDTEKINRTNMNLTEDSVFKTVYLPEVVSWYNDSTINNGVKYAHTYGCSGVDGISLGPDFGETDGKKYIVIALGVYQDLKRTDNDYQVLLQYGLDDLDNYAKPLNQDEPHHSGPSQARNKYFVYTGNTNYGVQNLEYDSVTRYWFMAVYTGKKSGFPNYPLFTIDGTVPAEEKKLTGFVPEQKGKVLSLAKAGSYYSSKDIYGWKQSVGTVGIESLGYGYFYIAAQGSANGLQTCELNLYKWTGNTSKPFELVQ